MHDLITTDCWAAPAVPSFSQQGAAAWRAFSNDGQLALQAAPRPVRHISGLDLKAAERLRQVILSACMPSITISLVGTGPGMIQPALWIDITSVTFACMFSWHVCLKIWRLLV